MVDADALQRLAERCGIALGYHDIFGNYQQASEPVLRRLLVAMGALPALDADAGAALHAWEDQQWRRPLPPVRVVREGGPARLRVLLPEARLHVGLSWHLLEEGGAVSDQWCEPGEQPISERREVDGVPHVAAELPLASLPAAGYHRLELREGEHVLASTTLIVVPAECYRPPALADGGRIWGPAVQLYTLRSARNWGIGDFSDLRLLSEQWAAQGADVVGLNPLHALFLGNPNHVSPYSPSSRQFLNVLYLDVEAVPEFAECEPVRQQVRSGEFQLRLQALREAELVDYPGVAAAKLGVLEQLYRHFREHHLARDTERARTFRAFQAEEGEALRQYALFEALYEHVRGGDPSAWAWMQWPREFHDPHGEPVREFAERHRDRVEFYQYLQWQAEAQLEALSEHLDGLGLGVGLYLDLAVSVDRGGVDGWRDQSLYARDVSVGAPPDDFNRLGQDWGLPPLIPRRLQEAGYEPIIAVLRENMRRAGALRIDHVMGLLRLYWVPAGFTAKDGAYVYYLFEDLLGIVALESHRNRCLVIGEDLGTVPGEVRQAMQQVGMLSYRVLFFEKDHAGDFKRPQDYPALALATVSTHDLPTLAGFWQGHDITLRHEFGLFGAEEVRVAQVVGRAQDRSRLLLALEREGLLPEGATVDPQSVPAMSAELARNIHRYLARTPCQLLMVQPEDVLGLVDQVNLPSSPDHRHPNWRRKLTLELEEWPRLDAFLRLGEALRELRSPRRRPRRLVPAKVVVPRASYRLQLNGGFTFRDATAIVPYLADLGVSHVYCSPYLKARPGSQHGYDIIDHNAINPEIGSSEEFDAFCAALEAHGMSQIMDVVPNHMGVMGKDNLWWLDVLENGPASVYAPFFDIDWAPSKAELRGKVLLPTLGGSYGDVLERGELVLRFDADSGSFSVHYYDHRMPIAPECYPWLLGHRLDALELRLGAQDRRLLELRSLITAFRNLPGRNETDPERVLERQRDLLLHKQRLARLCAEAPVLAAHIADAVADFNGKPGDPSSFDPLHELLEAQAYRLAHWHAAADEINYRRFFDIHDLAGLRQEDPRVFEATHQLVLKLVEQGRVQGLRIDHPDGLYDPEGYCRHLQERVALAAGVTPPEPGRPVLYLLVEKILALDEDLPSSWPVHGTTGYDFMNLLNGLFVDPAAERNLPRFYAAFTGEKFAFEELVYKCKHLIMKYALASELNVLANELNRVSESDRHTRDFTLNRLRGALAEVVAWLPVYRTYQRDGHISAGDRRHLEPALARASAGSMAEEVGIFEFLRDILLGKDGDDAGRRRFSRFVMRLQQYTGPVMAKGFEDTALYRYFPLLSLNEVGGDPRRFGVRPAEFHARMQRRQRCWPHSMLATSTHDNKRSEDVRARLNVLSELAATWRKQVRAWSALAARHKQRIDDGEAPSRNDEYLLYQTLIGAWPLQQPDPAEFAARVKAYMLKAAREAKRHTSWINQNPRYEQALQDFVDRVLADRELMTAMQPLRRQVSRFGLYNSLSQTLLKLTVPGVPDIYQGNELWDFSLVDPDNRRPVDYQRRRALSAELESLDAGQARRLLDSLDDGRAKLYLTRRVLAARRRHETLFRDGEYSPLASSGAKAEHVLAFARRGPGLAVVIAPRLYASLLGDHERLPLGAEVWNDTRIELASALEADSLVNVLTGEIVPVRAEAGCQFVRACDALASFPVALLMREG